MNQPRLWVALLVTLLFCAGCKDFFHPEGPTKPTPVTGALLPPVQYTITFDSHGGSAVPSVTADEGTAVPKPNDPTRDGYAFAGWFNAASGGAVYAWPHTLTESITVHARWTAIAYAITYELNGGSNDPENPATYTVESPAITLKAPTRDSHTFQGWYDNGGFIGNTVASIPAGSTGDKTFYARWQEDSLPPPVQYTITFDSHGGSAVPSVTANEGTAVSKPDDPAWDGYVFTGWFNAASGGAVYAWPHTLIENITAHARWTAIAYAITYELNRGSNDPENPATYTIESPAITLKAPERNGYTFQGWYDNGGFTGNAITKISTGSTGDKTFHAKWTAVSYAITYNLNGGDNHPDNPAAYTIESPVITLKDPARDDFSFQGWYDNGGFTGSPINEIPAGGTGAKTFYARWKPPASIEINLVDPSVDPSFEGITLSVGQTATFTVESESGIAAVIWLWNGEPIAGATAASYDLPSNLRPGIYELSVVVTDSSGERFSARRRVAISAEQGGAE
jgi:uncharacterized repeat protein (TIGR02543 family)